VTFLAVLLPHLQWRRQRHETENKFLAEAVTEFAEFYPFLMRNRIAFDEAAKALAKSPAEFVNFVNAHKARLLLDTTAIPRFPAVPRLVRAHHAAMVFRVSVRGFNDLLGEAGQLLTPENAMRVYNLFAARFHHLTAARNNLLEALAEVAPGYPFKEQVVEVVDHSKFVKPDLSASRGEH